MFSIVENINKLIRKNYPAILMHKILTDGKHVSVSSIMNLLWTSMQFFTTCAWFTRRPSRYFMLGGTLYYIFDTNLWHWNPDISCHDLYVLIFSASGHKNEYTYISWEAKWVWKRWSPFDAHLTSQGYTMHAIPLSVTALYYLYPHLDYFEWKIIQTYFYILCYCAIF